MMKERQKRPGRRPHNGNENHLILWTGMMLMSLVAAVLLSADKKHARK